jgi:hypothetical protein
VDLLHEICIGTVIASGIENCVHNLWLKVTEGIFVVQGMFFISFNAIPCMYKDIEESTIENNTIAKHFHAKNILNNSDPEKVTKITHSLDRQLYPPW